LTQGDKYITFVETNNLIMSTLPTLYTGSQFRIIRKEAGLSIYKLSKMTKISRTNISNFEDGLLNPTIGTYRKLLTALEQFKSNQP